MTQHDDDLYLIHLRECFKLVAKFVRAGRKKFMASDLHQHALTRVLQVMAESTQRLSEQFKRRHSNVPWRSIAGFRNVLVHGYLELNLDKVWAIATKDVPVLKAALADELRGLPTPPPTTRRKPPTTRKKQQRKRS